jgi:polysaccharide biosynthesis/export protein
VSHSQLIRSALTVLAVISSIFCFAAQNEPAPTSTIAHGPSGESAERQTNTDRPALQERYPRYRVTRSDVLSLSFPLSPEFNREVTVQPDGYINLQGTRSIYVLEMTVPEIVGALKKAYVTVLHDPIIDVDVTDFEKPFFIVGGQVNKPGQYELRHDTTVSQAIALAGGLNFGGKTQVFLYRRTSPDWVEVKRVNLKDIYRGNNVNEDSHLQAGDTLFVPEKFITMFRKYIPYSVGTSFSPQSAFTQ